MSALRDSGWTAVLGVSYKRCKDSPARPQPARRGLFHVPATVAGSAVKAQIEELVARKRRRQGRLRAINLHGPLAAGLAAERHAERGRAAHKRVDVGVEPRERHGAEDRGHDLAAPKGRRDL